MNRGKKAKNKSFLPGVEPLIEFNPAREKKGIDKGEPKLLKQGLHSVKQMFGEQLQLSLFTDRIPSEYSQKFGIDVVNKIDKYGINLNETQLKVMEGLLKAFTDTNYKGNTSSKSKDEIVSEYSKINHSEHLPKAYNNITEIPRIQIGQRELLRLSGINDNSRGLAQKGIEALNYLGFTQFCFYWIRLAYDKNGKPEKDPKTGNYKKEEVQAIDTLFKVKLVKDEQTKEFKYYEIEPSVVFLDQVNNYFLMIPYNWREEVKKQVGKKRASSYTFRLLLYLRYQYEVIRRYNKSHKHKKEYIINQSWEDIAQALKMPETIYKRNRERALKILDEAYKTAKELEYLKGYKRTQAVDILELNPDKYYNPEGLGLKP